MRTWNLKTRDSAVNHLARWVGLILYALLVFGSTMALPPVGIALAGLGVWGRIALKRRRTERYARNAATMATINGGVL